MAPCSQSDQTWVAVITALIGAFFLAMGWLANYWLAKRTELYKLALAHTDNQLAQFHGPLYYKLSSEEMVWNHFRFTHRPHEGPEQPGPYYRLGETETNAGLFRFRHYNQQFFIPQLQEIRDLIIAKGHLAELEQDPMTKRWCLPQCLIDLCACVGASEPMMMAWKFREDELQEAARLRPDQQLAVDNKFMEENIALVLFPPDIVGYAYTCYHKLLSRRAKQLRRVFNHGGNIDVHLVTPWEHLPLSSGSSITVES